MTLSVAITPTTHQSSPSHSAAHNALHTHYNTYFLGKAPPSNAAIPSFVDATAVPLVGDFLDGSSTSPLTGIGPTIRMTRTEAIPFATMPNPADNAKNALLALYTLGVQGSDVQSSGIYALSRSEQLSTHGAQGYSDACPALFIGWAEHGFGIGGYFEGRSGLGGLGYANGAEVRVSNFRGADYTFAGPGGAPELMSLWINCFSNGVAHKSGVGAAFASGDGLASFDKGIAFLSGAIYNQSIVDFSSSLTVLDMRGSHTTGIETNNGTFSGYAADLMSTQVAQLRVASSGAHDAGMVFDNVAGGQATWMYFQDASAVKWLFGKDAANGFSLTDVVNSAIQFAVNSSGHTTIGAAGKNLGHYGVTPVARQLFATGAGHTVDELITVLQNTGLLRQS